MTKTPKIQTKKQGQLMRVIARGNSDGTFCDLDQILENLPYDTTKSSLQFSLRALISKGFAERAELRKRKGSDRRVIKPTYLGYQSVRAL